MDAYARLIYPMCRQAGISTQEVDKFMAMLFLCHDFYPHLESVNITPRFLAGMKNPQARDVWQAMQSEGLKQGGVEKVNRVIELKELEIKKIEAPLSTLPPAQKMEQTAKLEEALPVGKPQVALHLGFYEPTEAEKKYLSAQGNGLLFIFEKVQAEGHQILFELRERAGLKRAERDPKHEEKYIFMPTQKALEKAAGSNANNIFLLRLLSGRDERDAKTAEDAAFLALHLNYKAGRDVSPFTNGQIELMKMMRRHSAGLQPYDSSTWDRLKKEKVFAEWPLKGYLAGIEKMQGLTRAYWQARELLNSKKDQAGKHLDANILQKWNTLCSRRLTNTVLEAETKALASLTNEMEEARKKGSAAAVLRVPNPNFKPTEFDLATYTNSETARTNDKITNMPSPAEQRNLSEVHKAVQEIEKFLGRKLTISSGFRTPELNSMLDKSSTVSSHMYGYAVDIDVDKSEHRKVMKWLRNNMTNENRKTQGLPILNQAIAYDTIIHIDVHPDGNAKNDKNRRYMQNTPNGKVPYIF